MNEEMADFQQALDQKFLNEFYLLVLVFVWHQSEKDLVQLAARADETLTTELTADEYKEDVLRLSRPRSWFEISGRLGPGPEISQYRVCWDILRPSVNLYKHGPFDKPNEDLLRNLGLDPAENYASLADSGDVREALCSELGFPKDERYSGIADAFIQSCQ